MHVEIETPHGLAVAQECRVPRPKTSSRPRYPRVGRMFERRRGSGNERTLARSSDLDAALRCRGIRCDARPQRDAGAPAQLVVSVRYETTFLHSPSALPPTTSGAPVESPNCTWGELPKQIMFRPTVFVVSSLASGSANALP